ncbi:DUF305 domain-containing protein [Oerskovia flava]|uniref:DUF305 domain-containing protein n=1 Tax=Oerskovia flava TaxID=2986422 RepID=UPI00223F9FDF|nr:DUF305 domain-containing protein [Oerskovia sp. JB1-3-2]
MKRILAPSLVLATALTLSACTDDSGTDMPGHDMPTMSPSPSGSPRDDRGDQEGEAFNHADVMFAQMMIPHHEQAIDMSDLILAKDGIDPQITDLATQIKAAQGPEIEQLTAWLDEWDAPGPDSMGPGDMDHGDMGGDMGGGMMDGMMSEEDMQALESAEGADAGRLFLEQMIVHHEGAIVMAQTEIDAGVHEGVVELSRSIVDSQTAEIQTMQDLLAAM